MALVHNVRSFKLQSIYATSHLRTIQSLINIPGLHTEVMLLLRLHDITKTANLCNVGNCNLQFYNMQILNQVDNARIISLLCNYMATSYCTFK